MVRFFVKAKHPEPPHYLCTMRRVVLGSGVLLNTNNSFHPMHVGLNPNIGSIATIDCSIKRLSFHERTSALKLHYSHADLLLNFMSRTLGLVTHHNAWPLPEHPSVRLRLVLHLPDLHDV